MKTSNLSGVALDWAVAKCEGYECQFEDEVAGPWLVPQDGYLHDEKPLTCFTPSTNWSQGGPIIEREEIDICHSKSLGAWVAAKQIFDECMVEESPFYGAWALQAAMRCYVASKLGDEIDIPEELK